MGVRWRDGDVPKSLVAFNKACSMGLGTVGVAGRPGGDHFADTNGAANWRSRSICVEISVNISGVRVCSPARNCPMSTVGISPSAAGVSCDSAVGGGSLETAVDTSSDSRVGVSSNNTASSVAVTGSVGPHNNSCSTSSLSVIGTPVGSPCWRRNSPQPFHSGLAAVGASAAGGTSFGGTASSLTVGGLVRCGVLDKSSACSAFSCSAIRFPSSPWCWRK